MKDAGSLVTLLTDPDRQLKFELPSDLLAW
jgi:hypothetical protein